MSGAGQGGGEKPKNDVAALGVLVLVGLMLAPFWWKMIEPHVVKGMIWMASRESRLLTHFQPVLTENYFGALHNIVLRGYVMTCDGFQLPTGARADLTVNGVGYKCTNGLDYFKNLHFAKAGEVWSYPSRVMLVPSILGFLLMVLHVRKTDVAKRFRRKFDLDGYIKHMSKSQIHLRPISHIRVDKENPFKGPWAVKATYISFALQHGLLRDATGKLLDAPPDFAAYYYDARKASEAFKAQMGKTVTRKTAVLDEGLEIAKLKGWRLYLRKAQFWKKPRKVFRIIDLADYEQALFGIFAAMVCLDRPAAYVGITEIQSTFKKNKAGNYTFTCNEGMLLAEKYWKDKRVQAIVRRHAYVNTLLPAIFQEAKERAGCFCSSQYIWLKPINRTLFYALHQVGLREANLEAAGPYIHRKLEMRRDFHIDEAMVESAVNGLEVALRGESWLSRRNKRWEGRADGYDYQKLEAAPKPDALPPAADKLPVKV